MNKLYIHERTCTPCSERVRKCVRWCSQHLFNVHTCTCMVLTTPLEMHAYSPQKMHMHSCMRAYATVQNLLCHVSYCELIFSLARASCRLLFAAHPPAVSTKSVAWRCSLKKSVQIHASSWRGRRCGVSQVSLDHPRWVQTSSDLSMGSTRSVATGVTASKVQKSYFRHLFRGLFFYYSTAYTMLMCILSSNV